MRLAAAELLERLVATARSCPEGEALSQGEVAETLPESGFAFDVAGIVGSGLLLVEPAS